MVLYVGLHVEMSNSIAHSGKNQLSIDIFLSSIKDGGVSQYRTQSGTPGLCMVHTADTRL